MLTGQRLAERYELLEAAAGERIFRARDVVTSEVVAIKAVASGALVEGGLQHLQHELRRVQHAAHPALLRYDALLIAERVLVREWVHGFSLLELLRWRKQLTAIEAMRLLPALPRAWDFLIAAGLPLPAQPLGKIMMGFGSDVAPREIATLPLAQWPPFVLKLNSLSLRASLANVEGQTTLTTVATLRSTAPQPNEDAPRALANLLYELLGGHVRPAREKRFSPLAALREEGNAVLRRALVETPYPDCCALWADLAQAQPSDLPAPTDFQKASRKAIAARIPAPLLDRAQPSSAVKLIPKDPSVPAVHLIARGSFAMGRSIIQADGLTRFFPETPANNELTSQLSRVHVLAELTERGITLRDGNGALASVNGSVLENEPLDAERGATLCGRSTLILGGVYHLDVVPLLAAQPRLTAIENFEASATPLEISRPTAGAVLFLPLLGLPLLRHAVWIFSEAGFGLDFARQLIWDTRPDGESRAMFHHHHGCFWLRNDSLPDGVLEVAGTPLPAENIAPLIAEQLVRIGTLEFTVEHA